MDAPSDYVNPDWGTHQKVHGWRNYISEELQAMWPHFTEEQKRIIAANADKIAGQEEWE